jgi:hypothetical protein
MLDIRVNMRIFIKSQVNFQRLCHKSSLAPNYRNMLHDMDCELVIRKWPAKQGKELHSQPNFLVTAR